MRMLKIISLAFILSITPNCTSVFASGEATLRFVTNQNLIGMKSEDLEKLLGAPAGKVDRGCSVPTGPEGSVAFGEAWFYKGETPDTLANLSICLLKGTVVDTLKRTVISKEGVIKKTDEEIISLPLIKELSKEII
jgi:hypothetical protein